MIETISVLINSSLITAILIGTVSIYAYNSNLEIETSMQSEMKYFTIGLILDHYWLPGLRC